MVDCNKYIDKMSYFRIQRKLTEGNTIKPRLSPAQPTRIKSLQSKHSFSRSPKQTQHESFKKILHKVSIRRHSQTPQQKQRIQEGIKAYKAKDVVRAIEVFKDIRKSGVRSAEVNFYLGSCLLNIGKYQNSITHLNQCLSIDPNHNSNAYLYIAICFKKLNNVRQAIRTLQEGLQMYPNCEEAEFYRGKLLMKQGETSQAIYSFQHCLKINPLNDLAILFLGDCYRSQLKLDKAIQQYSKIYKNKRKHSDLATIRTASLLIQKQQYSSAKEMLMGLVSRGIQNAELNYYIGLACYKLAHLQESSIYLEASLLNSKDVTISAKALKCLLKISVDSGNFYEAEHHLNRTAQFPFKEEEFRHWKLFIEGVSDLTKRKNISGCHQLQRAVSIAQNHSKSHRNQPQWKQFLKYVPIYLGYAYFITNKMSESLQLFDKALQYNPDNKQYQHCRLVAQGMLFQSSNHYREAAAKLQEAFDCFKRPESLFMASIILVQEFKTSQKDKQSLFEQINRMMGRASEYEGKFPLLLFYYSLVLLFMEKQCQEIIEKAIDTCDQPISEYFFVYALALNNNGRLANSLQAMNRAIEIDPNILQFYRERSKYFFLAEEYQLAIDDCRKAEAMDPNQEQIRLLLSFFLYLNDEVEQAYQYLKSVKPSAGKLLQFQTALFLRMQMFQKLGQIGQFILSLIQKQPISLQLQQTLEGHIESRYQYSQFSVYFFHLLVAVGYAHKGQFEKGLVHLFGCLEEIQLLIDQKQHQKTTFQVTWEQTEAMLDEVKFNITVMSLLMKNFQESRKYISVFSNETTSEELKNALKSILTIIEDQQYSGDIQLSILNDSPKISDRFPTHKIQINNSTLITRLLISYPVKLKFTIAPQFDQAYLLNFDIDKIEYKVPPPWHRPPTCLNFTNDIRNQSVRLSDSRTSERDKDKDEEISVRGKSSVLQHLKLDKVVEEKLQRLMKK